MARQNKRVISKDLRMLLIFNNSNDSYGQQLDFDSQLSTLDFTHTSFSLLAATKPINQHCCPENATNNNSNNNNNAEDM